MVIDENLSASSSGDLLFTSLDEGNLSEANAILDKIPVPLHYAADCADIATFQRIFSLERSLMDAQDQFGFTPLLVAAMAGNVPILEFLIEQLDVLISLLRRGAPLALADIHGAHPLHYATVGFNEAESREVPLERSEAILHVLLRHGAQLECTDLDGRTPLLWAASGGNVRAFSSLIQAGANRFTADRDRLGVLHCAASHGHLPVVKAMLDLGHHWVVNARDRNGDTPLFFASAYGHLECVKLLLERGADPNHQDRRIRTAAHCAAAKAQLRVLKILRQRGASLDLQNYRGDLPFHEAVQVGSKGGGDFYASKCVDWMLGIEPRFVSSSNFFGRTALHLAAASGNMEMVVLLCTKDAPPNSLMIYKGELLTPLDVAKRRGHDLIVDYLTVRYEARLASEISTRELNSSRQSIEEQIKAARLRKVRAELTNSDELGNSEKQPPPIRRGISLLTRAAQILSDESSGRGDMVDASTMVSRRSSSASAIFGKVPKATSTTDLNNHSIEQFYQQQKALIDLVATTNKLTNEAKKENEKQVDKINEEGDNLDASTNTLLVHDFSNASSISAIQQPFEEGLNHDNNSSSVHPETVINTKGEHSENIRNSPKTLSDREIGFPSASSKKVRLAVNSDLLEPDDNYDDKPKRIRRKWTPIPLADFRRQSLDEAVTELHILEDGISPPHGRLATFGDLGNSTTRYVHERAIFDELTHLKRMQIQYGKVREEVLVRSLVQNFCRMHAIHPAHFRRISTLQQWEKFLYGDY
uniref:ANK_REP_REGION domain-containing protein n=1 Tax=Meloidogyne hapla TaxID=6305 RepID=A0A1I8BJ32_MELHA